MAQSGESQALQGRACMSPRAVCVPTALSSHELAGVNTCTLPVSAHLHWKAAGSPCTLYLYIDYVSMNSFSRSWLSSTKASGLATVPGGELEHKRQPTVLANPSRQMTGHAREAGWEWGSVKAAGARVSRGQSGASRRMGGISMFKGKKGDLRHQK